MNELIKTIFKCFEIPVYFLKYDGNSTTYITYQQTATDHSLSGDDGLLGYMDYYDFDIYPKGNYLSIVERVKKILETNGFTCQTSRSSRDLFEDDTGYFHKTLCFAIEREV